MLFTFFKNCNPGKHILAVCFFQLILNSVGFAQQDQYIFRHLSSENGLLNNQVHSIYQDSYGYMWIGTINGLQRYDGNRFVNYMADLNDPEALHSSWVSTIFEDSKHRFWIGAMAPYQLNRSTKKLYNYNIHLLKGSPLITNVAKFLEDKNGDIWLYNKNSYYKLNNSTNQFEDYAGLIGITAKTTPRFLDKDNRGNLWFITSTDIKCYDPVSKKMYSRENNPGQIKLFDFTKTISSFIIARDDACFSVLGEKKIYKYSFTKNAFTEYEFNNSPGNNGLSENFEAKIDNIGGNDNGFYAVVLSGQGIAIYEAGKDTFSEIPIRNNDPNGLHATLELFSGIIPFKDREGNIWVSGDRGVNIINPDKKHFYFYGSDSATNKQAFPAYAVNGFINSSVSKEIYACYYDQTGGIVRFTEDMQFKKQYLYNKNGNTNLKENQIWCLFKDENGDILAPNQAQTMLKLNTKTDQLTLVNDSALFGYINFTKTDTNGDIWIGTWANGLRKIDHLTHKVSTFILPPKGSTVIPKNIWTFSFDGDSIIWVGTNELGLLRFDKRTNTYNDHYLFDENIRSSISSNTIKAIIPYNDDTLLLATGMGVNIFDKKKQVFTHISVKEGLPGNIVENMALDDEKNLWTACDGGFCKINMHTLSITRYGIDDGITDDIFSNAPFFRTNDGRFLVSGARGFMAFRPADITAGQPPPAPVITGFKIFDREVKIDSLVNTTTPLTLSYKENSIAIEFASLLFNSSDKLKYFYQLEGVDKDWILAGQDQSALYNQLQNGDYSFIVKCVNRDGLASTTSAKLKIVIQPPFWKTGWFLLLSFLILVGVIFYIARWLSRRRKEKELLRINYEKQIAVMEMKTLRAQMNPHFIFNSLNSINTFILKSDGENASEYLNKFSRLVRLILDNSRSEWVLLENELNALELYIELESIRFENSFSYHIDVDPAVFPASVLVPPLIIQPYVENAIWHGLMHRKDPGGKISIRIWKENDELMMQVEDNGVGRKAAEKLKGKKNELHRSYGMQITAERLNIINDIYHVNAGVKVTDLYNEANENGGTRVLLTIKFRTNAGNNH